MKILMLHNRYKLHGGEDESTNAENSLLRENGHEVETLEVDNHSITNINIIQTSINSIWSRRAYWTVRERIRNNPPDVVHIQNFFPLLSPAVHYAAKAEGKPVVQTLRNYRLLCINAQFFRNGDNCEDCTLHYIPWPGVIHRCYRESLLGSSVVAAMLMFHRYRRTWRSQVDTFITPTEFARNKLVLAGLYGDKIVVKPNFVRDPGINRTTGNEVIYIGRLSIEKGIAVLLNSWRMLPTIPLSIVGSGPYMPNLERAIKEENLSSIQVTGLVKHSRVFSLIKKARFLVFPTQGYETFGRSIIEAFAVGIPVVASRIGAVAELVEDGVTGLLVNPGDSTDLASKVEWLWNNPSEVERMGRKARQVYEQKYTPEKNYQMLMEIYQKALANRK